MAEIFVPTAEQVRNAWIEFRYQVHDIPRNASGIEFDYFVAELSRDLQTRDGNDTEPVDVESVQTDPEGV